MTLADANPYILIGVGGFFTGLGNIAGQFVWKMFFEKMATNHIKKFKRHVKFLK